MGEIGEHAHPFLMQFVDLVLLHLFVAEFPFPFMFIVLVADDFRDDERNHAEV